MHFGCIKFNAVLKINCGLWIAIYLPILQGETLPSPEPEGSNSGHIDFSGLTPSSWHVECVIKRLGFVLGDFSFEPLQVLVGHVLHLFLDVAHSS